MLNGLKVVLFVTNNINKFNEARILLTKHKISLGMLRIKKNEIKLIPSAHAEGKLLFPLEKQKKYIDRFKE